MLTSIKFILILTCVFTLSTHAQVPAKVVIKRADFFITTWMAISCDNFENQFRELVIANITDTTELNGIRSCLNSFVSIEDPQSMDVRASITITYAGKKEEYCVDRYGTFINKSTGLYYQNAPLFTYMIDYTNFVSRTEWVPTGSIIQPSRGKKKS